uniref:Uncharacterized protein n=1 Tax=Utricularia reniformis TaxID=192314 RepID=A0A1Y0B034_9LAMI|nr:hypothetical protein AEK19_MT0492 [Utricularia reniformis]ART30749.1 hypothetical protein AEK19_MT0492 [Utricularia reniformis]
MDVIQFNHSTLPDPGRQQTHPFPCPIQPGWRDAMIEKAEI